MRRSRNTCCILLTIAITPFASKMTSAVEMPEGWAILSEASTDAYYRDRIHSAPSQQKAVARLRMMASKGRPRQKVVARELINVIGQKVVADAVAADRLRAMKSDEKAAQFAVVLQGIIDPDGVGDEYEEALFGDLSSFTGLADLEGLAGSATEMARARAAAGEARGRVRQVWMSQILPFIRRSNTLPPTAPLLSAEIAGSGRGRSVWSAIRNISGKTLTNVTVLLRTKDGTKDLSSQCYFIREWPTDVVIRPDPFSKWGFTTKNPVEEPVAHLTATFAVWSDQGHTNPTAATCVGFYDLRDPFVKTMVSPGARYLHLTDELSTVLEFTQVAGPGKTVQATLTRTFFNAPEKPWVIRYEGLWVVNRDPKGDYDEVARLKLKLNEVGAEPLPTPPNRSRFARPAPPQYPSLTFQWKRPHYLIVLDPGGTYPFLPVADAKPAR